MQPRVTKMYLKGTFSYVNSEDEKREYIFDGAYDISTISSRSGYETVLFRDMGIGPKQVQLYYWKGHPSPDEVEDMLKAGKFDIPGDW